jgi:hypothetical protein
MARTPTRRARENGRGAGEFVAVGVGIGGAGQTTLEAAALMRAADKLFYCVVDPVVELWLKELNSTAESLAPLYAEGKDRSETYAEMVDAFVTSVRAGASTCAAYYGHPGMFVEATHRTIRQLRREGYPARMVPGVSADGCFYADALVNPGDDGIQSFEASRFLFFREPWNPRSGLLLWQVGVIGETDWSDKPRRHPEHLEELRDYLGPEYPDDHQVVLYFASTFPCDPSRIRKFKLRDLPRRQVYPMEMLYVPPRGQSWTKKKPRTG